MKGPRPPVDGSGSQLLLVAGLILLNAVFAGSEIALISLRETQIDRLARRSKRGQVLAALARQPNRFLSTIQIGITLAGFLASATAAITLSEPLIEPLSFLGGLARGTAVFIVTAILSFVTLVLGELAPKRLAMQRAEGWALFVARPLSLLATLAGPAIWVLSKSTDLVVRLFRGDPSRTSEDVTEEEVREMITTGDLYTGAQRQVIAGALEVADRTVRQVVTPRPDVVALRDELTVAEALEKLRVAGHTRAPVYREQLDDADRFVSVLGLLGRDGPIADHAEPTVVLPESASVLDALRQLQLERRQLAVVISEHGAVEGIVTVEDLVEELVGEIYDEHDPDVIEVVRDDDGTLVLVGRFPVHDLVDVEVDAPDTHATTLGGLVTEQLGRLPVVGDEVVVGDHLAHVLEVADRTVARVRLRRRAAPGAAEPDDATTSPARAAAHPAAGPASDTPDGVVTDSAGGVVADPPGGVVTDSTDGVVSEDAEHRDEQGGATAGKDQP